MSVCPEECALPCFGEANLNALKGIMMDSEIAVRAKKIQVSVWDHRCRKEDPEWCSLRAAVEAAKDAIRDPSDPAQAWALSHAVSK
jgi:hypothetical protein